MYRRVLSEYAWLADIHVADYLVDHQWRRLPTDWRCYFERRIAACDGDRTRLFEIVKDIVGDGRDPQAPLSLTAMKADLAAVCVSLQPITRPAEALQRLGFQSEDTSSFSHLRKLLPKGLSLRLKEKKAHEFGRIYDVVRSVLQHPELTGSVNGIVDIGAGVGHLSRLLALLLGKQVTTVEGNELFVERALEIDREFENVLGCLRGCSSDALTWQPPRRRTAFIREHGQISHNGGNVFTAFHSIHGFVSDGRDVARNLLVGVHTCGDLSPLTLRHFVANEDARLLLQFGCCYHKMASDVDRDASTKVDAVRNHNGRSVGFPMSAEFSGIQLSNLAREIATLGKERFLHVTQAGMKHEILFVCAYRAVLEWLLLDRPAPGETVEGDVNQRRLGMRGMKRAHRMDFWTYASRAVRRRPDLQEKIEAMRSNDAIRSEVGKLLASEGPRIDVICALRLLVAPLIESLILRDREAYLKENGCRASLVPLFDPTLSPRNIALMACKL